MAETSKPWGLAKGDNSGSMIGPSLRNPGMPQMENLGFSARRMSVTLECKRERIFRHLTQLTKLDLILDRMEGMENRMDNTNRRVDNLRIRPILESDPPYGDGDMVEPADGDYWCQEPIDWFNHSRQQNPGFHDSGPEPRIRRRGGDVVTGGNTKFTNNTLIVDSKQRPMGLDLAGITSPTPGSKFSSLQATFPVAKFLLGQPSLLISMVM